MKKIQQRFMFVLFVIGLSGCLESETDKISKDFFKYYEQSPTQAIDYAFKWMEEEDAPNGFVYDLKEMLEVYEKSLGKYVGYEKELEEKRGDNTITEKYIVKHEYMPLPMSIIYYKPKNEWRIMRIVLGDKNSK